MKKSVFAILLALTLSLSLGVGAGEKIRVGYSCCNFNDIFQLYVVEAAKQLAEEKNMELDIMDAQEDVVRQQDQIMTMLANNVDALIVIPVNTSAMNAIVQAAKQKNIPLVFVNRNPFPDSNPPANVYYCGADSLLEGETQMRYAGEIMGGKGNLVILQGILSNEATFSRTTGIKNVIKEKYPNIKVLGEETGNWQRDQGMSVMENYLTAYGDQINAVLSNNDNMALGALGALQNIGRKDVLVAGIDATPEALESIAAGQLTATVLQDAPGQGRGAVEIIADVLAGKKVDPVRITPAVLIDKKNVKEYQK